MKIQDEWVKGALGKNRVAEYIQVSKYYRLLIFRHKKQMLVIAQLLLLSESKIDDVHKK